jgi:hypothetical protein
MASVRVFISYAFVDEQHRDYLFAQRFAEDLRSAGAGVVVDSANVGEQAFVQRLNRVLPNCQWLIVIQSPDALQSLRVQMCVNTALQFVTQQRMQGVLAIVATLCDTQDVPLAWEQLPAFNATEDYPRALAQVLLSLDLQSSHGAADPLLDSQFANISSATLIYDVPIRLPVSSNPPVLIKESEDRPVGFTIKPTTPKNEVHHTTQKNLEDRPSTSPIAARKRSMRSPKRFSLWIVASLLSLTLVVIIANIFYINRNTNRNRLLPTSSSAATVTIMSESSILKNTYDITAVTGTPDASNNQVAARMISSTLPPQTQLTNAAGTAKTPGTQARGTVWVDDFGVTPMTFPAGTVFPDQRPISIQIMLDATANLRAYSAMFVPAHVIQVGTIGNLPPDPGGSTGSGFWYTYGLGGTDPGWNVQGLSGFSGGTTPQTYTTVLQSDINGAANALEQANAPNPQQVIQPLVHANEQLLGTPQCKPYVTSNHQAGDKATSVTVTVSFTCTDEVYDNNAAMALATNLLKAEASKQLGSGFALVGKIMTTLTNVALPDTQQKAIVLFIATGGFWVYQFDDAGKQELLKLLSGKSKQTAETLLLQQKGVRTAQVSITGGDGRSLPTDIRQITLNIVSVPHP